MDCAVACTSSGIVGTLRGQVPGSGPTAIRPVFPSGVSLCTRHRSDLSGQLLECILVADRLAFVLFGRDARETANSYPRRWSWGSRMLLCQQASSRKSVPVGREVPLQSGLTLAHPGLSTPGC